MTVAEQTFHLYVDDGSRLASFVMALKSARDRGLDFVLFKHDFEAEPDFDLAHIMDGLMTLGFSRTWTGSDDGKTGELRVTWK